MYIFLDSSVILAFCQSKKGASALILDYCRHNKLKGYISQKVISEVQKNINKKMDAVALTRFEYVLTKKFLTIVNEATEKQLNEARQAFTNEKDAPIIAAAKEIKRIDFIFSLDNGFFKTDIKEYVYPIEIIKPGEFINRFREELS